MFDLLIRGAAVLDGTGAAALRADVGVGGGRILEVGSIPADAQAAETVDAAGLALAPGFIDIHTHADIALLARPGHLPKIMQGVTTEVFTNCGLGFAPVEGDALRVQREYLGGLFGPDEGVDWRWRTVADLLECYAAARPAANIAYLIPHGAVRVSVLGMAARPASKEERLRMERLVRQGMEEGAWGLSTGLWYAPMCHADRAETVALCRAAGLFATHQRDYGAGIREATRETLEIAREAGVPVQLSHLQLSGREVAGQADSILQILDRAREEGVDVTWDSYPYAAGSTLVQALLPAWVTDGGPAPTLERLADPEARARVAKDIAASGRDWGRTVLAGAASAANRPYEGLPFDEIARRRGMPVEEFVCQIVVEEDLRACFIGHTQDEADVRAILRHPAQMAGSDGLHLAGKTHPRLYGTFPRLLSRPVAEGVVTLPEAVRKMTSAPADRLGLRDRGRIAPGMAADLVLFDPAKVRDTATFDDPLGFPEGIPHVWVNGVAVKRDDAPTGARPGRVLRRR